MALIDFRPLPEIPTGESIVVFHQATSMVLPQKLHSPLIFTDDTDQCSVPDSIAGFDFLSVLSVVISGENCLFM